MALGGPEWKKSVSPPSLPAKEAIYSLLHGVTHVNRGIHMYYMCIPRFIYLYSGQIYTLTNEISHKYHLLGFGCCKNRDTIAAGTTYQRRSSCSCLVANSVSLEESRASRLLLWLCKAVSSWQVLCSFSSRSWCRRVITMILSNLEAFLKWNALRSIRIIMSTFWCVSVYFLWQNPQTNADQHC